MRAESLPLFRRVHPAPSWIAVAVVCLLVGLAVLVAGALLVDVLGRSTEPLLTAPFRWDTARGLA